VRPATGGSESEYRNEREWILRCEGFHVHAEDGAPFGVVVSVVYDHSARWDAPHGLRIRGRGGSDLILRLESVLHVDVARGQIALRSKGVAGEDTPNGQ
jgi:hypothetical protein